MKYIKKTLPQLQDGFYLVYMKSPTGRRNILLSRMDGDIFSKYSARMSHINPENRYTYTHTTIPDEERQGMARDQLAPTSEHTIYQLDDGEIAQILCEII